MEIIMAYTTITETTATLDDFDRVNALLPASPPEGLLLGIRGMGERGLTVVTLWRSKQDSDRFSADHLGPALAQVFGDPAPPPLHSISFDDVALWGEMAFSPRRAEPRRHPHRRHRPPARLLPRGVRRHRVA